jgi:uncharacterized small protein (DUF1192 family)
VAADSALALLDIRPIDTGGAHPIRISPDRAVARRAFPVSAPAVHRAQIAMAVILAGISSAHHEMSHPGSVAAPASNRTDLWKARCLIQMLNASLARSERTHALICRRLFASTTAICMLIAKSGKYYGAARPIGRKGRQHFNLRMILSERFRLWACAKERQWRSSTTNPRKSTPARDRQDLSLLSLSELSERIGILRDEIARLEAELRAKDTTKSAAEALFRRG